MRRRNSASSAGGAGVISSFCQEARISASIRSRSGGPSARTGDREAASTVPLVSRRMAAEGEFRMCLLLIETRREHGRVGMLVVVGQARTGRPNRRDSSIKAGSRRFATLKMVLHGYCLSVIGSVI